MESWKSALGSASFQKVGSSVDVSTLKIKHTLITELHTSGLQLMHSVSML